ncbi:tRNA-specific 2-thiouridylase [Thermosulfidibacter takaii ABI70S6]|uniref:tRNA-specific 2-thiouridylase MnmA n=1 Tax=Thermosulfidibacter takaii (strain DSM 17441 / JCM 13301 / NBRC 103674 / ABI70S6) TaxID=1298851 RepID=A0A0S3QTQ6_THET7|nr:tRNA 2-thiouridine(34) synthase MnmA [Thermosulfidibacter takaii]BAT71715.1 tRNA-specific 2-thiouridylase [Thermosulfidibacter takaii ABI70S6]
MPESVFVAISGGVDSTYALMSLMAEGYEVVAVFMDLGLGYEDLDAAKHIAFTLGVNLRVYHLKEIFEKEVINYFVNSYLEGKTPNPCAICNKKIKFGILREHCFGEGASFYATGHYACLKNNRLYRARDKSKDQSYFLSLVEAEKFINVLFPMCDKFKSEVKEKLKEVIKSEESQEICFLRGRDYRSFLLERVGERPGKLVDTSGKILGEHKGHFLFTIGQRRGLGVPLGRPLYVVKIIPEENMVVLGSEKELYKNCFFVEDVNWFEKIEAPVVASVKIRHQHEPAEATVYPEGRVVFETPQRAITPGQVACFYQQEKVLGAGIVSQKE